MKFCNASVPLSLEKQGANPLASIAKVLLTGVFSPYCIDSRGSLQSRIAAPIVGSIILYFLALESRRIARGHTYEPPTFYETSV